MDNYNLRHVNNATFRFFKTQLREQQKKCRGSRYTLDDKILALSLLKNGPKCYRFLQRTFALQSRRTLMALFNKMSFACGINEPIIKSLEFPVATMKPGDRNCCLLFDKTFLEPSLTYSIPNDTIIGFKDLGSSRHPRFANHVLVFMARGMSRKWKQPVAYYLTDGGLKSTNLTRILKEVITRLHEVGLRVVATVFLFLIYNERTL